MTEEQKLTALLRLKRYEQPPAGYYEKLLQDVHRRQRVELLQRPLWAIGLERLQTFFSAHSMGNASFAGAMAAVVVAGLTGLSLIGGGTQPKGSQIALASAAPAAPVDLRADTLPSVPVPVAPRMLTLQQTPVAVDAPAEDEILGNARLIPASVSPRSATTHQPRYVIDTRPVSYEATKVSFSF